MRDIDIIPMSSIKGKKNSNKEPEEETKTKLLSFNQMRNILKKPDPDRLLFSSVFVDDSFNKEK